MSRDGLHDVVLEEDPEPAGGLGTPGQGRTRRGDRAGPGSEPGPEPPSGGIRARVTWWSRRHRVLVAVVGVVVLLAIGAGAADVVRERERAAVVNATARVLDPVSPSIAQAWSVPGGWEHSLILGPASTIGEAGLTLAVFATDDGSVVVANDLDSGAELWTAPLPTLRGRPRDNVGCRVLGEGSPPETATHVVCRYVVPLPAGAARPTYGPGAEARLVVLDARTGERVAERSLGVGFGAMDALGRDVVLVDIQPDGRPFVTREDPVTGTVRWTFRADVPMPSAGLGAGPPALPAVGVRGDVITVIGPVSWALSTDGRQIDRWGPVADPRNSFVDVAVLPDGRLAVGTAVVTPEPAHLTDVRVVEPGARDGIRLDAGVTQPVVDDGSASDLLLTDATERTHLSAVDAVTGETRWTVDYGQSFSDILVMDRRLIQADHGRLVALDTESGAVLWTALEAQLRPYQQLFTDGDVVLVPTGSGAEPMTIYALDLEDGRTRWTAVGPADVVACFALDGKLVALQQETTIGLR
jgi:outer membrane protein assembly factor BamB